MGFLIVVACCIAGLAVATLGYAAPSALGFFGGLAVGLIIVRQYALSARLDALRGEIDRLRRTFPGDRATPPAGTHRDSAPAPAPVAEARPATASRAPDATTDAESARDRAAGSERPTPPPPPAPALGTPRLATPSPRAPPRPDPLQRALGGFARWFSTGNVPVKVGMLVLFAGVAALLKYASDEGWLRLPVEFRLIGIALAASAALAFGWRERERRRNFALALQGGAIGVLVLTVFAAFRLYALMPPAAAFALLLVLVAGVGLLAVLQDALALAVLGILAGFAAPILISTGSGNHVVLFSYYALLNLAIFAIAWVRAWRVLNLLGFAFTFAIGTVWGVLRYDNALFASTEPFLLLYFAIYLAIPILHVRTCEPAARDRVDAGLVFGNPLVAFALQAALLDGERMPLAYSALVLAAIYAALAWWLLPRRRMLGESFAVLGAGFATLSVPLAWSARTTACTFALEGAGLIWLGLRQQRLLPRIAGLLLQLLAAGAFVLAVVFARDRADAIPIANALCISALLIAAAGLVSAWLYHRARRLPQLASLLYLWGLTWWLGAGLHEIDRFVPTPSKDHAVLAFAALTAMLAALAAARLRASLPAWSAAIALACGVAIVFLLAAAGARPFAGWGLAAFAVYAGLGGSSLRLLRDAPGLAPCLSHLGWLWTWTLALALALRQLAGDAHLGAGWTAAASMLPLLAAWALALLRPRWIAWPLTRRFAAHRWALLASQTLVAAVALCSLLLHAGASTPLPFIPLLNPLELVQIGALLGLALWLGDAAAPTALAKRRAVLLAIAGFAFVTAATLRATHQLGGVAWDADALWASNLAQTSLTVVWSVLGVVGWVLGSRRGQRLLWLAAAALMAVVLAKLLLVDRGHLGNLFGIASFIAYGLLCTLIGYLAPAPPRMRADGAAA